MSEPNNSGVPTREISWEVYLRERMDRHEKQVADLIKRLEEQRIEDKAYNASEVIRIEKQRLEDRGTLNVRLGEHQAAHDREHQTATVNAEKDEKKLDNRLMTMNEFRGSLTDLSSTMATRQYVDTRFDSVIGRIEQVEKNLLERLENVVKTLDVRLRNVEATQIQLAGKSVGGKETVAYIFAGLGALATIVSLFLLFSGGQ